ncbi:MAG: hypothetical protein COU67_03055 [Candidatus Pacebacteria bacterium CG10_big_fil_rev_8_21_14_0_10_44_54]|nr:MAG: hypothetical protein COU67_03055 [Candidatus Pacebacteria bacterium CG10_big_fil_rev_8_21_14_0_10_44_54]
MSYYFRWGLVIGQPVFQRFLRENYALGLADLEKAFAVAGFNLVSFPTKVPTFRRFTMVKKRL